MSGPGIEPLTHMTLGQVMDRSAKLYGDREALVVSHQSVRKSFGQLAEDVDRLAAGFLGLGLKPGDRIGIWGPNVYEWYLTMWAAGKAGLILVNINPAYQPSELKYCLNKVNVKALLSSKSHKGADYYAMLSKVVPEVKDSVPGQINSQTVPDLKSVILISEEQHGSVTFMQPCIGVTCDRLINNLSLIHI